MYSLPAPLEKLISEFERLPGVGPKSAARMAYHFLRSDNSAKELAESLIEVTDKIVFCENCFNVSEDAICEICNDSKRDQNELCIVEEVLDLLAFEKSGSYQGVYFVLGGVISPVNGIGPEHIRTSELIKRIKKDLQRLNENEKLELIFGLNPTMEGEATILLIKNELDSLDLQDKIKYSKLARGLPTGADLEYADGVTLKRALEGRTLF
ncbi:recombination protein RecR [Candidatus Dojkabacteria bacterium]|uniref:Recombination protein RecR n=1 Tax=Candidatus Dojkabacteria bacterium TaxID=2099670 RepID=A0A955RHY8_9BACT|nr:recombination protein RecR [Candidatus Dojkabacteria bacterium]